MGDHPQDRRPGRLTPGSALASRNAERDTIAAIATASGRAGIGMVRVSGPGVRTISTAVIGRVPQPRRASLCRFVDAGGTLIDTGIAILFACPASYTGEDILELHSHGSQPVLELLLEAVLHAGARLARPGEFTERAFLEGRLDLVQAEAVADLIDAGSEQAARAAQATLCGEFSRRVEDVVARLTAVRARLEASLDFADEELGLDGDVLGAGALDGIGHALQATLDGARQGVRLRDGLRVALVGAPNVGKSSIMNRLAGEPRAIVTAVPGTTRDVLREELRIGGALVELLDTAGLHDSDDEVERVGMERAREHASRADLVLLVTDATCPTPAPLEGIAPTAEVVTVRNKVDLCDVSPGLSEGEIRVSALTGAGFEELIALIARRASYQTGDGAFTARQRHVLALEDAMEAVKRAQRQQGAGVELVAEELRHAQLALGCITGTVTSDDLLGEIFSTFCIGK